MRKTVLASVFVTVGLLLAGVAWMPATASAEGVTRGGPGGRGGGPNASAWQQPSAPLDASEVETLNRAILEEYGALNTYQAVLDQFGDIYPFNRISRAESMHVQALTRLATRYGLTIPANPGLDPAPTWDTVADACATGVTAEIADADLYDELLPQVDNADIIRVFNNLKAASLNNHLPAFQSCD